MPEDIQELKDYLEEMRGQAILGQCCADLDVHDMTVLIAMINKFEKYEKALKELVGFTKYEGNQWYENLKDMLEVNAQS